MKKNQLTELQLTDKERSYCEGCLRLIEELQRELPKGYFLEGQDDDITKDHLEVVSFTLNALRDSLNLYVVQEREE